MKIHRFITDFEIKNNQISIEDRGLIHQWRNVLKLKTGENLILSREDRLEALCVIENIDKYIYILKVIDQYENTKEIKKDIILCSSVLKKENFELVIQKVSEIGITKIVPIISERTIKTNLNFERLNKIAKEASELCGRSSVLEINEIINFKEAILNYKEVQQKVLFDSSGETFKNQNTNSIVIFIGPEGGYSTEEINFAKENNYEIAKLGELTFRAETANIIASFLSI